MGTVRDFLGKREAGWGWNDASIIAADMEVDKRAASSWLPGWLRLLEPARATVFVADYPDTSVGIDPYHETTVLLHVRLGKARGLFCPWMLVDDDAAMLQGREVLGYPKKMGDISLSIEDDRVKASAERKGVKLLEITGDIGSADPAPPPLFARNFFNVWGQVGITVQKILFFRTEEEILEARNVSASVTVGGSERDPLDELRFGAVKEARLYRLNLARTDSRRIPLPLLPVSPKFMMRHWNLRYR